MKMNHIPIELPSGQKKLAFVLENVYSPQECEEMIRLTEAKGYEPALVNIGGGRQMLMTDYRNSDRCIIDDEIMADGIFQRIKKYIPGDFKHCQLRSLNERLRFLRYDPGQYFASHRDGTYVRESGPKCGERSCITVQLYLNGGFEGGSTTFLSNDERERVEVVPKPGLVLIFQHDILHEGSAVTKGRKYSMRTDVMYRP